MAAPHVAGVAALLKAKTPTLHWWEIKNRILAGAEPNVALANKTISGRRLYAPGALTCSQSVVRSRLKPIGESVTAVTGAPIALSALSINCAASYGEVKVTVNPGGTVVTLRDDGQGEDLVARDGTFSGQWTPTSGGEFTLTFFGNDSVTMNVTPVYSYVTVPFSWETIPGTNLHSDDDGTAKSNPHSRSDSPVGALPAGLRAPTGSCGVRGSRCPSLRRHITPCRWGMNSAARLRNSSPHFGLTCMPTQAAAKISSGG